MYMVIMLRIEANTVSKNNNILHINGKKYDARTGAVLDHGAQTKLSVKHTISRAPARHAKPHPQKSSRTLMRHIVKKPVAHKKAVKNASEHAVAKSTVALKHSVRKVNQHRVARANKIGQSKLISHFRAIQPTAYTATSTPTPPSAATSPVAPAPKATPHTTKSKTASLLDNALKNARSHEQPPHKLPKKRPHKRLAGIGATAALVAVIIGIIVTQNLSDIQLQMASAKAGFAVSMPTVQPAGYSLGELTYTAGSATTNFQSNSDDRAYTITQKKSDWSSMALRDIFVTGLDPYFETIQLGDRDIYIYNDSNATWVDDGIWYTVQSDGALSNKQLIDLAGSL